MEHGSRHVKESAQERGDMRFKQGRTVALVVRRVPVGGDLLPCFPDLLQLYCSTYSLSTIRMGICPRRLDMVMAVFGGFPTFQEIFVKESYVLPLGKRRTK